MSILTTRRRVVGATAGFLGLAALPVRADAAALAADFPRQDDVAVKAVVGLSHRDFDAVKAIISARPALAKASWDWGFGDWESALGAASHVGRPDIAALLMDYGAQPNLFTHAMMGHLAVIQAAVGASPGVQRIHGPHGIPLLQHALATTRREANDPETRKRAQAVADYLRELGGADAGEPSNELSEAAKQTYLGAYRFGLGEEGALQVGLHRTGAVTLARGKGDAHNLRYVEEHGFAPAGAPAVRIRFAIEEGKAVRLVIHDPEPVVTAERFADS